MVPKKSSVIAADPCGWQPVAPGAPPVWRTANWDRSDDHARATAVRWWRIAGARRRHPGVRRGPLSAPHQTCRYRVLCLGPCPSLCLDLFPGGVHAAAVPCPHAARARAWSPAQRVWLPLAHRSAAARDHHRGEHVFRGHGARASHPRRLQLRPLPAVAQRQPDDPDCADPDCADPDHDDGCARGAAGALRTGHRGARPRPVPAPGLRQPPPPMRQPPPDPVAIPAATAISVAAGAFAGLWRSVSLAAAATGCCCGTSAAAASTTAVSIRLSLERSGRRRLGHHREHDMGQQRQGRRHIGDRRMMGLWRITGEFGGITADLGGEHGFGCNGLGCNGFGMQRARKQQARQRQAYPLRAPQQRPAPLLPLAPR